VVGERTCRDPGLVEARKIDKQQLLENIGLRLSINRVKCALLPLKVLVVGAYGAAGAQQWRLIEVAGGDDG